MDPWWRGYVKWFRLEHSQIEWGRSFARLSWMITKCLILWLLLWIDHLLSLCRSFFIYYNTKIKIIFGFNLAVHEEESVSDMFMCQVNYNFLNPSWGGRWTRGGVGSKVPSKMISSIQSLTHTSPHWAISWFNQSHFHLYAGYLQLYPWNKPCF